MCAYYLGLQNSPVNANCNVRKCSLFAGTLQFQERLSLPLQYWCLTSLFSKKFYTTSDVTCLCQVIAAVFITCIALLFSFNPKILYCHLKLISIGLRLVLTRIALFMQIPAPIFEHESICWSHPQFGDRNISCLYSFAHCSRKTKANCSCQL